MSLSDYGLSFQKCEILLFLSAAVAAVIILLIIFLKSIGGFSIYKLLTAKNHRKAWYSFIPVLNYVALGELAVANHSRGRVLGKAAAISAAFSAVAFFSGGVMLLRAVIFIIFEADSALQSEIYTLSESVWQPLLTSVYIIISGILLYVLKNIFCAIALFGIYRTAGKNPMLSVAGFVFPILIPIFLYLCAAEKNKDVGEN